MNPFRYHENGMTILKRNGNGAAYGLVFHFPVLKISFRFELINLFKKRKMNSHPTKLKGKNTSHHKEFHQKEPDFSGALLYFCTVLKRFRKK